jgi:hypothetical protein
MKDAMMKSNMSISRPGKQATMQAYGASPAAAAPIPYPPDQQVQKSTKIYLILITIVDTHQIIHPMNGAQS